jgi:hypothetical protein
MDNEIFKSIQSESKLRAKDNSLTFHVVLHKHAATLMHLIFSMKNSLLLAFLSVLTISANAYDFMADGLYYNITSSNTVEVTYKTKATSYYSGDLVIPGTVSYNGSAYTVTSVGKNAFNNCSNLTSVEFPSTVISIGDSAFIDCKYLTTLTIPNSVNSIGTLAFYNTKWLQNQGSGVVYAGSVAYCYKGTMHSSTSITLRDGTNGIAAECFFGLEYLVSISIPNSVVTIGRYAFGECGFLTSITIPKSVISIDQTAFYETALNSIVVQSGNPIYDSRDNCNAIIETSTNTLYIGCSSTIIPSTVTSIGGGAFYACRGFSITIPNSVSNIGNQAFAYCSGLRSINIPNSVTHIGDYAFQSCENLSSITIPNSITSISKGAFYACMRLSSVDIPNTVTSIGDKSFYDCRSLTSVTIPGSVTEIGDRAFYDCHGLREVRSKIVDVNNVALGDKVFRSYYDNLSVSLLDDVVLMVPYGSRGSYMTANQWKDFGSIKEFFWKTDITGDLSFDGIVNGTDLNIMVNLLLNKPGYEDVEGATDLNDDGRTNAADLNRMISIILGE